MKNVKNQFLSAMAALMIVVGLSSCDTGPLSDAVDDFAVVIGLEPINTSAAVMITDAATGELITDAEVTVTFEGDNGNDIIDMYSDPITEMSVRSGVMTFGISNTVTPSEDNPARVTLSVQADGYLDKSRTILLDQTGSNEARVSLVSENNVPAGVTVQSSQAGSAGSDGSTSQDISVETNATGTAGTDNAGGITIPAGTQLLDSNGNPLSGQITAKTTFFNPDEQAGMANLPIDQPDDALVYGAMQVSLVDENGNEAADYASSNAKAKARSGDDVTKEVHFVLSGERYNNNESSGFRLVYFDIRTYAQGTVSSPLSVTTLPDSRVRLTYNVPGKTDLYYLAFNGRDGSLCDVALTLNTNGYDGDYRFTVSRPGHYASKTMNGDYVTRSYADSIRFADFQFVLPWTMIEVPESSMQCEGEVVVDFPPAPENIVDLVFAEAEVQCQNEKEKLRVDGVPSSALVYRKVGAAAGTDWLTAKKLTWNYSKASKALEGGTARLSGIEKGEDYIFKIAFDGETYDATVPTDDIDSEGNLEYTHIIDSDQCE